MTQHRVPVLVVAAVLGLAACEPLLDREPASDAAASAPASAAETGSAGAGSSGTGSAPASPRVAPSVRQAPTVSLREEPSRGGAGRALSPAQIAAMTQARMSVSDGEIMRQLANTAERIAQQLAKGDGRLPPPGGVHPGTNRALGYKLMTEFGWPATEWPALDALWYRESGWNHLAENRSSGAYGIPQSLPASKMAAVGPDWQTNPETQIRWGLAYIGARYGSPRGAWQHSEQFGWY